MISTVCIGKDGNGPIFVVVPEVASGGFMASDRKKPGVAFWATVAGAAVVLYVLSSGPANLLMYRGILRGRPLTICGAIYWPLRWLMENGPEPVSNAIRWYAELWVF